MERRTFLKLVGGLAAAAGAGSPIGPATAAGKEIVYLTPGLDLPFWRYLSKGVEAEAKKEGYSYQALEFAQQRRRPSSRTRRTRSRAASPAS